MPAYTNAAVKALGARGKAMAAAYRKPALPPGQARMARAQVKAPPRVKVAPPRFMKPIVGVGDEGPDYTPNYTPGNETTQAPTFYGDPSNALALAMAGRTRREAEAKAGAKKKQAAIEYGEGAEGEANPFSVKKVQERNYRTGVSRLDDDLNAANLFYSGYRAKSLGEAATNHQQQQYESATRYRSLLADIDDALAAALVNADMLEMQGGGNPGTPGDNGAGFAGRPGEHNTAGVAVLEGWDPSRNSDAKYDTTGMSWNGHEWVDAAGWRYDADGRRK